MPAMSPTMTEGNITNWKVREGDIYSTGDVLLQIETDKTQMDVEAQEDGKLAKIVQKTGAKGVKVGSRIAVLVEEEDDLSSLEIPSEESSTQETRKSPKAGRPTISKPSTSPESRAKTSSNPSSTKSDVSRPRRDPQKQTYPLYPSVAQLLHGKGLPTSEADHIPATGPKGRLLKGDVLAYLGFIESSYSSKQSTRISRLGQLDLSNVKPAPQKRAALPQKAEVNLEDPLIKPEIPPTEIAVPISLTSALSVKNRVQETLGISLPLSTFIARATELANEDLPKSPGRRPTADELFNDVLGLQKVESSTSSRGNFFPQVTTIPLTSRDVNMQKSSTPPDIYKLLTSNQVKTRPSTSPTQSIPGAQSATSVFSVSAVKGEERRARVFLERVKTMMQVEPGRLIL